MKVKTARLAAGLATALLIAIAMVSAAAGPAPPEATVPNELCATAPVLSELGEAQEPVEAPGLTVIAPEPVPASSNYCETACLEAWAVCIDACPGNPGEPENDACRSDCHSDKQRCLIACWRSGSF